MVKVGDAFFNLQIIEFICRGMGKISTVFCTVIRVLSIFFFSVN